MKNHCLLRLKAPQEILNIKLLRGITISLTMLTPILLRVKKPSDLTSKLTRVIKLKK